MSRTNKRSLYSGKPNLRRYVARRRGRYVALRLRDRLFRGVLSKNGGGFI
ncbi:MAG: hypothetical protein P5691_24705 [Limnospira sp. PMC 1293.21]|nr:hypothetical protein [Limnospira sp. PMC 1293.21]